MDFHSAGQIVLETLSRACSQSQEILKPAEQQLKEWETQPGFYSILLAISSNHTVDANVRWLSVLYFKNGVDRYWRKNSPHALQEGEKEVLKQQLISNFNEPVPQIATQLAVLIAKIARQDCPQRWQELIPTLLEAVKSDDILKQKRVLLTLYHVTKAMSTKRLANDRRVFEELTRNIFDFVLMMWNTHTDALFHHLSLKHADGVILAFDHSILSLKVLRTLCIYGFQDICSSESALSFIDNVIKRIHMFVKAKSEMQFIWKDVCAKREKVLTVLTKVLLNLHEASYRAFARFIKPALDLVVMYNFTPEGQSLTFERFTVNIFNIMRSILRCQPYKEALEHKTTPVTHMPDACGVRKQFFTNETLTELSHRIILNYLPLTQDEMTCWDSDPEGFAIDEGGDSWKFTLRPCAENLYMTLVKEYRADMIPIIVHLVQKFQVPVAEDDLHSILQKDAVYNAIGLGSFEFYDEVDFDQWFTGSLLGELQNQHSNWRIIRRRVIWLIGNWTQVKLSVHLRPKLYEAIIPLLNHNEDMVVRIETTIALRAAIDDFDFKIEAFAPYLEPIFSLLFQLLKDAEECETKMTILNVMCFIIERMETKIKPFTEALIQHLPLLWDDSAEHNMLRCAILTTLTNLVEGFGSESVKMHHFLLPVVHYSTDINQEAHIYLLEDGLELWLSTLRSAPSITPELLHLYENMPQLIDRSADTLPICLKIIQVYITLAPHDFLHKYGANVVQTINSMLTELKSEGIVLVLKVVELVFKIAPEEGPQLFHIMLPGVLKAFLDEHEYPMVVAKRLSLICRMILSAQPLFWQFIDTFASQCNSTSVDILSQLLETWFEKQDNLVEIESKKLTALAMCQLITHNTPVIYQKFGGIINIIVETLHDVCRTDENGHEVDYLIHTGDDGLGDAQFDTEHDKRKRHLQQQDPVFNTSLKSYAMTQLNVVQQQHGPEGFHKLMERVDPEIYQQLQTFMK